MPVTPLATAFLLLKLTCLVLTLFHPFYVGKAPAKKAVVHLHVNHDITVLGCCQYRLLATIATHCLLTMPQKLPIVRENLTCV